MAWRRREAGRRDLSAAFRPICLAVAIASVGLGVALTVSHPVLPIPLAAVFIACVAWFAWQPSLGILALPALLPVLNFSPWTGWLIVDEFDLLILAVVSGGYFRLWRDRTEPIRAGTAVLLLVAAAWLIGRGLWDVGLQELDWFSGYMAASNALRVGKPLVWIALLLPLTIAATHRRSPVTAEKLLVASLLGSGWVILGVFWERAFYPGLMDITTRYRTVGLFWEMHHGGAALDVYLVLIAPVLVWAWRRTVSAQARILLGAFVLAFAYACLTTFSRGVVFAACGAVTLQWILVRRQDREAGRAPARMRPSSLLILALLCVETVVLLGPNSFLNSRLRETDRDFEGRLAHWKRGIGFLESPTDWLFGIGLGRLPVRLREVEGGPGGPGGFEMGADPRTSEGLALYGPVPIEKGRFHGLNFALSQRFDLVAGASYRYSMNVRSPHGAVVLAQVCVSHLLYPARCSNRIVDVAGTGWQQKSGEFPRTKLGTGSRWQDAAHGVFLLSVLTPGAVVEIEQVRLEANGTSLLENPRFAKRVGRWFPQSFHYFVPWHIDNLYLELLIETGICGMLAFLAVVIRAMAVLLRKEQHGETFTVVLLSSTMGLLAIGMVVSVLDMPRVSTLFGLFLVWTVAVGSEKQRSKNLF